MANSREHEILNRLLEKNGVEHYVHHFSGVAHDLEKELSSSLRDHKKVVSLIAETMLVLRQISMSYGIARVEDAYLEKVNAESETLGDKGRAVLEFPKG